MSSVRHQHMTTKKSKDKQGREDPGAEIIVHPSSVPPSPFLEEINTVRLEGALFRLRSKTRQREAGAASVQGRRTLALFVAGTIAAYAYGFRTAQKQLWP